jgi:O-antigen ligase
VKSLGRNITLTDRTRIWQAVLQQDVNPIFGTGFYSFWMGPRAEAVWETFKGINQAHNGYLETYLNGGFLGLGLLVAWLLAAYKSIQNSLKREIEFARMQFVILIIVILYNFTEATFNRLSPPWLALLLVTIKCPFSPSAQGVRETSSRLADEEEMVTSSRARHGF